MARRDRIVVGTSAGGVEALPQLVAQLPTEFPAAILIVQHLSPVSSGHLADIVQRATPLPVRWAEHGDVVRPGTIVLAPPNTHMLIAEDHVVLAGGPRENHSRPSINRLFRSAAASYDGRTVGVLLTGLLDDGVAGLAAIGKAGGVTVVQDPGDAAFPDMPLAALAATPIDHVLPLSEMGELLVRLTEEEALRVAVPDQLRVEASLDQDEVIDANAVAGLGPQMPIACPECSGPLWEVGDPGRRLYRCYLGHVQTAQSLQRSQGSQVERALWSAVRALQERATTYGRLAADARARNGGEMVAEAFARQSDEAHDEAQRARAFLLELQRKL